MDSSRAQKIIQLMRAGDRSFIDLLYEHYADTLYGWLLQFTKDEALAKDALQDSFVKFWQKADLYDPDKSRLFTWLLAICRNTALDKLRSRQLRQDREVQMSVSDVYEKPGERINPDTMDVNDHLAKLEEKYREVIQALFFDGMTQQEASDALGIPLGTVKSRLKIGLRMLRGIFNSVAWFFWWSFTMML